MDLGPMGVDVSWVDSIVHLTLMDDGWMDGAYELCYCLKSSISLSS